MTAVRAALLLLLLAAAAPAQEETRPSAREVLARTLAEARRGGALQRLLGEVAFKVEQDGMRLVVRRRGELREEDTLLACQVILDVVAGPGAGLQLQVESVLDLEQARLRSCSFVTRIPGEEGPRRAEAHGELDAEGKRLQLKLREPDGTEQERSLAWGDDVLPWSLLFFLPSIQDQGLPAQLSLRVYDETRLEVGEPTSLTCVREQEHGVDVDVLRCTVRPVTEPGKRFEARALAEGPQAGTLRGIRMRKWESLLPITAEEAAALLGE